MESLRRLLSEEEQRAAARFRFPEDRQRAILARGALRVLLGGYLQAEPRELSFSVGSHGKPCLTGRCAGGAEFNVSHSGGWVVIGVSKRVACGVDVERVRTVPELDALIDRCLTPGEAGVVRSLAGAERVEAFFAGWTRKEACIKAIGTGLSMALDRLEVTVRPGQPAALLALDGFPETAAGWTLWAAAPEPGYLAAAAAESRAVTVVPRRWTGGGGVAPWPVQPGAEPLRPPGAGRAPAGLARDPSRASLERLTA